MQLPRVLLVIGKGGVGRSTLCAALGEVFAARGERTLLLETADAEVFGGWYGGGPVGYKGRDLKGDDLLHAISLSPGEAIREYLMRQVRFRLLYRMVFGNRPMRSFLDAVLGLSDLITMGKVADLERETRSDPAGGTATLAWDRIIVDMPATGHGMSMLGAPWAMAELTRVGPLHRNAVWVQELLDDPQRSALIVAGWAEDLPVTEAVESINKMGKEGLPRPRITVLAGLPEPALDADLRPSLEVLSKLDEERMPAGLRDAVQAMGGRLELLDRCQSFVKRLADAAPDADSWQLPRTGPELSPIERVDKLAGLLGQFLATGDADSESEQ